MDISKAHAKARMAMKKREEEIEQEELEGGELNLVPYLDIATNLLLFMLASLSSGILFGHINTSLPDHAPSSAVSASDPTKSPEEQLQLVVSVTQSEIRVWSISGLEGTLKEPKARIARRPDGVEGDLYDYPKLNDALAEIVIRRWGIDPGKRKPETTSLILQADAKTRYETIISVMDHTRTVVADPNDPEKKNVGLELFPKVHFSTGFQ